MAERLVADIIAAARYWRATQTTKGVLYQSIDHAHRCLQRAVDDYEAALEKAAKVRHPDDCECAPCWSSGNHTQGASD